MTGVQVIAPGPIGFGTKMLTSEGVEIKGIRAIRIAIEPAELIAIEAELNCGDLQIEGQATFHVVDPSTGALKQVKRIEFDDGSSWAPGQ